MGDPTELVLVQRTASRRGFRAVLLAILVGAGAGCGRMSGEMSECRETRPVSAEDYWFWEGYRGVTQTADHGTGRKALLAGETGICLRVELGELSDPAGRTRGYKRAIEEWFNRIPVDPEPWSSDPDVVEGRKRVEYMTGLRFAERDDWKNWWVQNRDYLRWSDSAARLIVSLEAQRSRLPLDIAYEDIPAEEYWFFRGRGWFAEDREEGGYLLGTAWIPPEGSTKVRVEKGELAERSAKELGYRRAAESLVLDGVMLPELKGAELAEIMAKLRALTEEQYNERAKWIEWWNRNGEHLRLSEDGERLTAR
jgi:hypothetical protein